MDYKKEFINCMKSIDNSRNDYEIFSDFLTLASLSVTNAVKFNQEYENEYLQTIRKYSKNQGKFPELLAIVVNAFEQNNFQDFLGEVFMQCGFGSKRNAQFFTPYHVSEFMAQITLLETDLNKDYITLSDPCCGAGGMIIAGAEVLYKRDINPQTKMFFVAQDIDKKCFEMTYIQTSLIGLAGQVIWGDTLTLTSNRFYNTPMTCHPLWRNRFKSCESEAYTEQKIIPISMRRN